MGGLVSSLVAATSASACSLLLGTDGLSELTPPPSEGGADAGSGGSGGGDGGPGSGSGDGGAAVDAWVGVPCGSGDAAGTCVPPGERDWEGPVVLFEGALDASAPACPAAALPVIKGQIGLVAPPAMCAPCACNLGSASCSTPSLVPATFPFFTCSGDGTSLPGTQCVPFSGGGLTSSAEVSRPSPIATCTPSGGQATVAPPTFSGSGTACKAPEVTDALCPSGQTCRESPPAGFAQGKYCIYSDRSDSCPRDVYTERHQVTSGNLTDDRGCSSCRCDVNGGTCDSSAIAVQLFSDTACTQTTGTPLTVPSACRSLGGTVRGVRASGAATLTVPPTCSPTGGSPRGSARGSTWTICCTP